MQLGDKTGPNSTYFVKEKNGLALDKLGSSKFACRKKVAVRQTPTDPPLFAGSGNSGSRIWVPRTPKPSTCFPSPTNFRMRARITFILGRLQTRTGSKDRARARASTLAPSLRIMSSIPLKPSPKRERSNRIRRN